MLTDWVLVRRLGYELDERLRGARLLDAGLLADGRAAIVLRRSRKRIVLALDLFGSPPLVTVESGEQDVTPQPGFLRALAAAAGGMALAHVSSRRGDRLLRLTFRARSRFGVAATLDLYLELVPRFGNAVLVKGETVVAAAKEFSPAENRNRTVLSGRKYALPPLPKRVGAPACALADSPGAMREPLFAYRRGGALVQANLVALPEFSDAELTREPSLLELFAELRAQRATVQMSAVRQQRRRALLERLDRRERKLRDELLQLGQKRARTAQREELRLQGDTIFGSLHELPEHERNDAKERAAAVFAAYKKLGAALPHLVARERAVEASIETVQSLRWEAERAGEEELNDVEHAVALLEPRARRPPTAAVRRRKRPPLEVRTDAGSRILIGRSPSGNAELTFEIARPNDLWFHAQGVPGAHVVLARDDRLPPPPQDLQAAAALAAFHSKARANRWVPVDYTQRKYVRKRRDAPPGLVWYTHATTVLAQPSVAPEQLGTVTRLG